MRARIVIFLIAIATMVACSPESSAPRTSFTHEIVIAADFAGGAFGADGRSATEAVEFAVAQQPTIGPFRLSFRSFDDSLAGWPDYAKGVENIKSMVADPAILGMVGPFNSLVAQAEIPVASENSLVMISPATTSDCLTRPLSGCQPPARPGGVNNYFRIAAADSDQARAMAAFAVERLSVSKVAVLSDGYPYGEGLADRFATEISVIGGHVVRREQIGQSINDFSGVLASIKAAGAQAVFFGGSGPTGSCRIRSQMAAILPDAYFLGADGIVDQYCVNDAAAGANDRMIATMPYGTPLANSWAQKLVRTYEASGRSVATSTFAAYDCAEILIDAIHRVITGNGGRLPSRQQVIDAVKATQLQGITGRWSFEATGDAMSPGISFYRVKAGGWTYWQSE